MFDFVTLEQVHLLHERSLREHGGSSGVRDPGLIESALGSAQNAFYYGGGDEFDVAAAYAFHLAESQAFIDGNKRTGLSTALYFLAKCGHVFKPAPEDQVTLYDAMIAIAKHELDKPGLAAVLRQLFGK
jgi:death-on-curing protein